MLGYYYYYYFFFFFFLSWLSSFNLIDLSIVFNSQTTQLTVVYLPGHPGSDVDFLIEFGLCLERVFLKHGKMICDFNYWVYDPLAKPSSTEFMELVEQNDFTNQVTLSSHMSDHILDLVLSQLNWIMLVKWI